MRLVRRAPGGVLAALVLLDDRSRGAMREGLPEEAVDEGLGAPAELRGDQLQARRGLTAEVAVDVVDIERLALGVDDLGRGRDRLDLSLIDGGAVVRHDHTTVDVLDFQGSLLGASLSESA